MWVRFLFFCAIGAAAAYLLHTHLGMGASQPHDTTRRHRYGPRRFAGSRARNTHPMSVEEAASLLGISPRADEEEIKAAHRRAIKAAHPDTGGDAVDAARINLARDTLLAYYRGHES